MSEDKQLEMQFHSDIIELVRAIHELTAILTKILDLAVKENAEN